ncbi:hypothetical protein PGIGA_G00157520 [Pangasianodon gigas]|uniref:Uncharacterized protein n=1 Tax=Pangasianodon gigas TaxID=30993 RepID=A0ACC5XQN9_PANGG|nr:hypothetical protein [Pangasianodon gigas]
MFLTECLVNWCKLQHHCLGSRLAARSCSSQRGGISTARGARRLRSEQLSDEDEDAALWRRKKISSSSSSSSVSRDGAVRRARCARWGLGGPGRKQAGNSARVQAVNGAESAHHGAV